MPPGFSQHPLTNNGLICCVVKDVNLPKAEQNLACDQLAVWHGHADNCRRQHVRVASKVGQANPIALSAGEAGGEIQAPMAMVIRCGLLSSTAHNMVVVPVVYERFGRPVPVAPVAS